MNEAFLKKYQVDLQNQSITFSCATQFPCERFDQDAKIPYQEILIINDESVNLDRLNLKAPLLFNHDTDKLIGVVQKAWVQDQRVFVRVRFSQNDQFSKRVFADIIDGIIAGISIGYTIEDYKDVKQNGVNRRYVTKFMIYQVSAVSIPADTSCSLRKFNNKENKIMKKQCAEQLKNKECGQEKLQQKQIEVQEQKEIIEQDKKQEIKEQVKEEIIEDKVEQVEALKAENEALKAEIEKLKQDKVQVVEEQVKEEKVDEQQVKEIEKIAEDFNVQKEEVERAIKNKMSVRDFKQQIKNKNFNVKIKDTKKMDSKREFSEYLSKRDYEKPFTLRDFTGFGGKSGENGESLIGTDTIDYISALEKKMGVKGFRTLNNLHYNISIPVQTGRNTVYQTADLRTAATTSNPQFTQKVLTPVKLSGNTVIGTELIVQSNTDIVGFIIDSLSKEIAYKLEDFILGKVVAANPTEINYSALSAITWDDILAFEAAVGGYNLTDLQFIGSPSARAALKSIPKASNYPQFLCDGENKVNGYDFNVSGCVSNNNLYFLDTSKIVLGVFGQGLDILVNPYKYSTQGMVQVTASICVDAVLTQPDAAVIGKVQESSETSQESDSSL